MKKTALKNGTLVALAIAASASTVNAQMNRVRVEIDGAPLRLGVAPVQINNRTLVPMRAIFNALGAQVNYNSATRQIMARRGNTDIELQLGSRYATVDGRNITLDQAPLLTSNRTLVPLRFVSEALGAQVNWNEYERLVTIQSAGGTTIVTNPNRSNRENRRPRREDGGFSQISVPSGAVVRVELEDELSSATARNGDTFFARVVSQEPGDSEFPTGTRLEGVVTQATPSDNENPGVLEIDFRNVVLADGTRLPLRASLTALDNDSIDTTTRGRIMARQNQNTVDDDNDNGSAKAVIVGGAAGYLIGRLTKRNSIITSVIGAAGGYLYDRRRDRDSNRFSDAVLARGTEIGVRLDNGLTYQDAGSYARTRREYMRS